MIARILRCVLALLGLPLAGADITRPHLVLILADDLGWADLGSYGNRFIETPALDGLARAGLRFTQAYAGAPICTPHRAALLTGCHAARLHITGQPGYRTEDTSDRRFAHPPFRTAVPPDVPALGRTLRAAGYRVWAFGKWGLDNPPEELGFTMETAADDDALTSLAVARLRAAGDAPFFLYFNPTRPHVPLRPPRELLEKYRARRNPGDGPVAPEYAAEVEALDRNVARLLRTIDELELTRRTVVMFTSDNGGFLGYEDEVVTTNAPWREGKASLHEGGLRVPLIVRWPGVTPSGETCEVPVHAVDWHATLAEIAGGGAPAPTDGRSFVPLLRGHDHVAPRSLFWHYPHYRRSRPGLAASPSSAVRAGDWKLIHFYETDAVALFNLARDPGEAHDLAASEPARAAALHAELDAWRRAVGAQSPVPNRPRAPSR
jgi:arylsulfatase A-like enzyme